MHYTGTESWTYAMAIELSKEHEVIVWSPLLGKMAQKLTEQGIEVVRDDPKEYDFAIVNHNAFWDKVKEPKVFTSHSKIFDIEKPPETNNWVGVNEYIGERVIRNGVDLERFHNTEINETCKNILLLSNPNYSQGKEFVKNVLKGYNVITIEEERFDIENLIKQADLVISLQRGAIESLAMGKNVIYADWREYDKYLMGYDIITEDNYELFKTGQMRANIKPITSGQLLEMVKQYNPKRNLRHLIEKDFNIKLTAKQYLQWKKN